MCSSVDSLSFICFSSKNLHYYSSCALLLSIFADILSFQITSIINCSFMAWETLLWLNDTQHLMLVGTQRLNFTAIRCSVCVAIYCRFLLENLPWTLKFRDHDVLRTQIHKCQVVFVIYWNQHSLLVLAIHRGNSPPRSLKDKHLKIKLKS